MKIPNSKIFSPPSVGNDYMSVQHGTGIPLGASIVGLVDFKHATVGSGYWRKNTANHVQHYIKIKDDGLDSDWFLEKGIISQKVFATQCTDGGSTSGTKALNASIPVGAVVAKSLVGPVVGFTGDTTCTIKIGDGTTADRYLTGTPSVFTTVSSLDVGVVSGTAYHSAAKTPTLTFTSSTDFTIPFVVTTACVTVYIVYYGINL